MQAECAGARRPSRRGFTLLEVLLATAVAAVGLSLWGQLARDRSLREDAAFEGAVLAAHGATAGNLAASEAALRGRMADPANPLLAVGYRPYSLLEALVECFQSPTQNAPGAWRPGDVVASGATPGEMPPEAADDALDPSGRPFYANEDFPPAGSGDPAWRGRWRDELAGLLNEGRGGDVYRRAARRIPLRRDSTTGGADNVWRAISMSCLYFDGIDYPLGGTTPPAPTNFREDQFKIVHSIRKGSADAASTFGLLGEAAPADYVPGSTHCVDSAWVSPAGRALGPGNTARPDNARNIRDASGTLLGAGSETHVHYLRIDPDTCMGARLLSDAVEGVHWRGGVGSAEARPEFFVGFADPQAALDAARESLSGSAAQVLDTVRSDPGYFRLTGVVMVPGFGHGAPGGRVGPGTDAVALAAGPGAVVFDDDGTGAAVPRRPGDPNTFARQFFPRPTTGPGTAGAPEIEPGAIAFFSHLQETDAVAAWIGTVTRNASILREETRYSDWRVFERSLHHQPEVVECDVRSAALGRCNRYGAGQTAPPYASLLTREDESPDLTNDHGAYLLPEDERRNVQDIGGAWVDQMRELVTLGRQELTGNLYSTINPTSADSPAGAKVVWADYNVFQHGGIDANNSPGIDGVAFPLFGPGVGCTAEAPPAGAPVDNPYSGPCVSRRLASWRQGGGGLDHFTDSGLRSAWSSNGPLLYPRDARLHPATTQMRGTILDEIRLNGMQRMRGVDSATLHFERRQIHGSAYGERLGTSSGTVWPSGDNVCKAPFVNYWRPGWRFDGGDSFVGGDRSGLPTRLRDRRFHSQTGRRSTNEVRDNTQGTEIRGQYDDGEYLEAVDLDRLIPPHAMFQNVFTNARVPLGVDRIDGQRGLRTCAAQHLYFLGLHRDVLEGERSIGDDKRSLLEGNVRANDRFGVIRSRGNLVLGFEPEMDGSTETGSADRAREAIRVGDGAARLRRAVKTPHERVWPRFLNVGSVGEPIGRLVVRGNLRVPQVRVSGQADLVIGRALRAGVECTFLDSSGRLENGMLLPTIGVAKMTPYSVATWRSGGARIGHGPLVDEVARYRPRCLNSRDYNATRPSALPHGQVDLSDEFPGSGRVVRNAGLLPGGDSRSTVAAGGGTRYREHPYVDVRSPSGYGYREIGQLQGEALARVPLRGLEIDAGEDELPVLAYGVDSHSNERLRGTSIVSPRTPSIHAKRFFSDAATRVAVEVGASNFDPDYANAPVHAEDDGPDPSDLRAGARARLSARGSDAARAAFLAVPQAFNPPRAASGVGSFLYQCLETGEIDPGRVAAATPPADRRAYDGARLLEAAEARDSLQEDAC